MEAEFLTLMRAELDKAMAQLELRLVDRFASKKDHEDLEKRLEELDKQITSALDGLSGWRNRVLGGVTVLTFAITIVATASWHIWG